MMPEAMAMPLVAVAVGLLVAVEMRYLALAGVAFGLAFWLRYQVATAALGAAIAVGIAAAKLSPCNFIIFGNRK